MRRIVIALLAFTWMSAAAAVTARAQDFVCSAGPRDGLTCPTGDAECDGSPVAGACVLVQGVCDGGDFDGFPCDCPGGLCSAAGLCQGGAFDGESCGTTADASCGGAPICVGAYRVCGSGEFRGFGCLRSDQCGTSVSCISSGKFCDGGDYADYSCVVDADCNGTSTTGVCRAPVSGSPTPTPVPIACVGDCGNDGEVTVDELIRGVNIALGSLALDQCPNFDSSGDGEVTVDEIVQAVNAALAGCVTSTPTPTTAVATPTPTNTLGPLSPGRAVAGRAALIGNGLGAFPPLVTAIIRGLQIGQTLGLNTSPSGYTTASVLAPATSCPLGGQVLSTCSGVGNVNINITFTGCTLATDNGSVTFESGTIGLRGAGACPNVVVAAPVLDEAIQVNATFRDSTGTPKLLINANVNGSVTTISVNPGVSCFLNGGDVTLSGYISAQSPGGSASRIDFENTAVNFLISQFNADCVPLAYRLKFNGSDKVSDPTTGDTFDAVLQDFVTAQDSTTTPPHLDMSGRITSPCFGGAADVVTEIGLVPGADSLCFAAGRLRVTSGGNAYRAIYQSDGSVGVDLDGDSIADETHASCTAAALRSCLP